MPESLGLQDLGAGDRRRADPPRLGDTVRRLGLADTLERAGHALHRDTPPTWPACEPPVQVRLALEELGPTFVKLGQILAGRADLLGPDWIAEFGKLHSQCRRCRWTLLRAQLREDLGGEPEACSRASTPSRWPRPRSPRCTAPQLHDGTEVVVKIRRPGIVDTIEADLRLLERLAAAWPNAEWPALKPYRPSSWCASSPSLRRELDLAAECRNAERVAANLAPLPDV
jgi:ubiquinone biosynthesis protein